MKFKLHLLYFMNKELAPLWVRIGLGTLTVANCFLVVAAPLVDCDTNLSDNSVRILNMSLQTAYLISLAGVSLFICCKILHKLKTDTNEKIIEVRKRLIFLEVMVQLILLARWFTTIFQKILAPIKDSAHEKMVTAYMVSYLSIYFLLSELLPLTFVVYGIYLTIEWKHDEHTAIKGSLIAVEGEIAIQHSSGSRKIEQNSFSDSTKSIQKSSVMDSEEDQDEVLERKIRNAAMTVRGSDLRLSDESSLLRDGTSIPSPDSSTRKMLKKN